MRVAPLPRHARVCGCAATPRPFPLREPFVVDTDMHPVSVPCRPDRRQEDRAADCAPAEYVSPFIWDQLDNLMFARLSRGAVDQTSAARPRNVNSLDEVADSAWFTNRIARRRRARRRRARRVHSPRTCCLRPTRSPTARG